MKRAVFFLFLLFVFVSCVVDNVGRTDYSDARPVCFNISIDNQSSSDKVVIFERTNASNEEFNAPNGSAVQYEDIVCIDNRWEKEFVSIPTGMHGKSTISIIVGDKKEIIGDFRIDCAGKNPNPTSYGEFVSGNLKGVKDGTVKLRLVIDSTGTFVLEYL